ncbi:hypothetical protein [Rhizobium sp. SL86]|uniref:hypothetical protein n=1 Tax=Rhizobium sp. SL86 TaxID=2995148 RepID=UPI002274CAB5|nr:hypothetical protein [Rhizobium sp. SL86]MCY1665238.1 hypothetical protein [Rhizobium sp. SL86]
MSKANLGGKALHFQSFPSMTAKAVLKQGAASADQVAVRVSMSQQAKPGNGAAMRGGASRAPGNGTADDLLAAAALFLMTVAAGKSRLCGVALSQEMTVAIAAARAFGATIETAPDGFIVSGLGTGVLLEPALPINVTGAPLTAALLIGLVSSHDVPVTLVGEGLEVLATPFLPIGLQMKDEGDGRVLLCGSKTPPPARWRVGAGDSVETLAILLSALNTPGLTVIDLEDASSFLSLFQSFGAGFEMKGGEQGKFTLAMIGRRPLAAASFDISALAAD